LSTATDVTEAYAEGLNVLRSELGPAGDLGLLRHSGEDGAGDNLYESLKTYPADEAVNGWHAETVTGKDGGFFTRVQIADSDGTLAALVDGDGGITEMAIGAHLFRVEPEEIGRPVTAPLVWTFRVYATGDVYTPEPEP
jgi:hypothetical protein